jgi:hypothetical protein
VEERRRREEGGGHLARCCCRSYGRMASVTAGSDTFAVSLSTLSRGAPGRGEEEEGEGEINIRRSDALMLRERDGDPCWLTDWHCTLECTVRTVALSTMARTTNR